MSTFDAVVYKMGVGGGLIDNHCSLQITKWIPHQSAEAELVRDNNASQHSTRR